MIFICISWACSSKAQLVSRTTTRLYQSPLSRPQNLPAKFRPDERLMRIQNVVPILNQNRAFSSATIMQLNAQPVAKDNKKQAISNNNSSMSQEIVRFTVNSAVRQNETRVSIIGNSNELLHRSHFVSTAEDEDAELLCILKLYMDSFVNVSKIDMNDRLIFLVPLIIIYWRHRHPNTPLPFQDIDNLLREVGNEALLYRVILSEVSSKVEQRCIDLRPSTHDSSRQPGLMRSFEALKILRNWIDDYKDDIDLSQTISGRQSGIREIRRSWWENLINSARLVNRVTPNNNVADTRAPNRIDISTTTLQTAVVSQDITTEQSDSPILSTSRNNPIAETTTEPFGWPHYENRTKPHHGQTDGSIIIKPKTKEPVLDKALMNCLKNLKDSAQSAAPNSRDSSQEEPTQTSEFFRLVSSIIDEMIQSKNDVYNTISG